MSQQGGETVLKRARGTDPIARYLAGHWYMYPYLTPQQVEIVLRFTRTFAAETEFSFSPGVKPAVELTWLVGANAALVGGAQRTACFSGVRWVYLLADGALAGGLDGELSGDALGHSTVRINAADLVEESRRRLPGCQIAVHEFAHVLDQMFGISDSTPALREGLEEHLANRRDGVEDIFGDKVVPVYLDDTAGAEFFASASEVFFTDPHGVLDFYPPLYDDLVAIYGLDMADQLPDLAGEAL